MMTTPQGSFRVQLAPHPPCSKCFRPTSRKTEIRGQYVPLCGDCAKK